MVAPEEMYMSSIPNVLTPKRCCLLSRLAKYAESEEDHCDQPKIHTSLRNIAFQSHLHLLTHISINVISAAVILFIYFYKDPFFLSSLRLVHSN